MLKKVLIKKVVTLLTLTIFIVSQSYGQDAHENLPVNSFYQYSIWLGFVNKVYDGGLTVESLKKKGDMALGSFSALDGELVMDDGIVYQVSESGVVKTANPGSTICYANAVFFSSQLSLKLDSISSFDELKEIVSTLMPSKNCFYAFKITGDFDFIKCGGLRKQQKPYAEGLDVLIPRRPVFVRRSTSGTMTGFYCPEFIGDINVAGFHFHFISSDKEFGGHVMESTGKSIVIQVMPLYTYTFELPEIQEFEHIRFDKKFQYKN